MDQTSVPTQGAAAPQISAAGQTGVQAQMGGLSQMGGPTQAYKGRPPGAYVPGGSWKTWLKLFINFLTLHHVTDETERKLILLQEIGQPNYELLESLLQGKQPEDATMAEICEKLEKHFQPKKLLMAERYNLLGMQQKSGQSLGEYWAEVQKNANNCAFEKVTDFRDVQVTMVFVGGISSVETRKRLLEREDLSSKEALELAEAYERVGKSAPTLKDGNKPVGISQVQREYRAPRHQGGKSTHHHSKYHKSNYRKSNRSPTPKRRNNNTGCYSCGSRDHQRNKCPVRSTARCANCQKQGHLAIVCKAKRDFRRVNYMENESDSDMESIGGVQLVNVIKSEDPLEKIRRDNQLSLLPLEGIAVEPQNLSLPLTEGMAVESEKLSLLPCEGIAVESEKLSLLPCEGIAVESEKLSLLPCEGIAVESEKLSLPLTEGMAVETINPMSMKDEGVTRANGVHIINTIRTEPPAILDILLNNVSIPMELDTGASMSIVNGEAWEKLGRPILSKAGANLQRIWRQEYRTKLISVVVDVNKLLRNCFIHNIYEWGGSVEHPNPRSEIIYSKETKRNFESQGQKVLGSSNLFFFFRQAMDLHAGEELWNDGLAIVERHEKTTLYSQEAMRSPTSPYGPSTRAVQSQTILHISRS